MITELPESQGNILMIRASDKLTDGDYHNFLIPRLEKILKEHGKARVLFYLGEDFQGATAGAVWTDTKFGLKHRSDFDKMAMVGGARWMEWMAKLFSPLMKGELKTFTAENLDQAKDWIRA